MTKDLQLIAKLLLIAVTLLFTNIVVAVDLHASTMQEQSEASVLIQEQEAPDKPEQVEELKLVEDVETPTEDTVDDEEKGTEVEGVAPTEILDGKLKEDASPIERELAEGESEVAAVVPTGFGSDFLTEEHLAWIWWLIYLLLALCFLAWLLALMTPKSSEQPSSGVSPDADASSGSNTSVSNATSNLNSTEVENPNDIGTVYTKRPADVDDLTKIGGIDAHDERRLNEAGIWHYDQLKQMTAQQRANLQRKLNLPRLRWYSVTGLSGASAATIATESKKSLTQTEAESKTDTSRTEASRTEASTLGDSTPASTATSGDAVRVDATTGKRALVRPPKFTEDLTKLPGVDKNLAAKLNEAGIHNLNQLQNMTEEQQASFEERFGIPFAKLNVPSTTERRSVSGSVAAAGAVATGAAAALSGQGSVESKSGVDTTDRKSAGVKPSTSSTASENNPAAPVGSTGFMSTKNGQTTSSSTTLNDPSLSQSSHYAADTTNKKVERKGRVDETFGFFYTAAPSDSDDLTQLDGVDEEAAARLNAAGIYKFEQLENLDDQQATSLAEKFNLPDADFSDWRRCFYAWGRGIQTTAEADENYAVGSIHGIELPKIAAGVFDGEKLIAYPEQVIFRGSNPEGWGRGVGESIEGVETSLSCDSIRSDINYLRIRRTDTRESVVVPMTKGQLFTNGGSNENGWNGSSEVFFGGRHIGVFAQDLPQEVETKFSQGGWGFGHRYDHNDRQEWGWAGRVIEPTSFEISVGCIGNSHGTVVFRSSDPTIWNTRSRDGEHRFANPISSVNHPVHFVRIMREATGEAIIVRVDGNHILDEGFDPRCGWNGSGSEFSGGMHLGVYHSDLPQDFETRFEFGGWGFGHPYNDNDRQAWGWAGRQLPETAFEISLLESVPDFMEHELVN